MQDQDERPLVPQQWKPVVGYGDKYEVSDHGSVRVAATGHVKNPSMMRGYRRVSLYYKGRAAPRVHQLVAAAFLGPRPEGMEIRHLDGNRLNNHPSNLAYGTHQENVLDRRDHGTAINAHTGQTHCKRGHEFTAENTEWNGRKRACRACVKLRTQWRSAGEWDSVHKCHVSERADNPVAGDSQILGHGSDLS